MKILSLTPLLLLAAITSAWSHCQVPCGIFHDDLRFHMMLEDQETVAKAGTLVRELAGKTDAESINQSTRWIINKESHAQNIQDTIAEYFLAQRIKSDAENYDELLKAAHAVTVAAMKTKQTVDTEQADTLKNAILALYKAYMGKEYSAEHTH
ncbi:MAG: superoxide dismutase [Ni] [Verrucomicrobiota bacterium]